jgi:phage tail-like protein
MGLLQKTAKPTVPTPKTIAPLLLSAVMDEEKKSGKEEFPVPVYQFSVLMDDQLVALFQTVSGIAVKREVDPLTVGGQNSYTLELPGQVSYDHITLEVGLGSSSFFYDWMMDGQYDGFAHSRDFSLIQRRPDPEGKDYFKIVRRWEFRNAYPVGWKISDLTIDNSESIVIESLELSFDFFEPGQV